MGSPWKMPTQEQCQELIDNTTSTWTRINNVFGAKLTSKTNTSKYIFLPEAGWWDIITVDGERHDYHRTGICSYWSATQYSSTYSKSQSIYFSSSGGVILDSNKYHGLPIRPVR